MRKDSLLAYLDDEHRINIDVDEIAGQLSGESKSAVIGLAVADVAIKRLRRLSESGTVLKSKKTYNKLKQRAELEVLEDGVTAHRVITDSPGGDFAHIDISLRERDLQQGDVLDGRVYSFSSLPAYCGRIILYRRGIVADYVRGLVDPKDGHPRVKLDIFRR